MAKSQYLADGAPVSVIDEDEEELRAPQMGRIITPPVNVFARQEYVPLQPSVVDRGLTGDIEGNTATAVQDEVPYARADVARQLHLRAPDLVPPPPVIASNSRGPEYLEPPDIAPAPLPSAVVPDDTPQMDVAETAAPVPYAQAEVPGLKLDRPYMQPPPPVGRKDVAEPRLPAAPEIAARAPDTRKLSALTKLPTFSTTMPAVTAAAASGAPIRTASAPVKEAMPALTSKLLQPEHRTGNRVVVSVADKRMVVYDRAGMMVATYPVYVGTASNPTPRGQFRVMENIRPKNSEWYYGGHWLGFAQGPDKGNPGSTAYYGFHGWQYDKDDDIEEKRNPGWKTSTHGCVQLSNEDVASLSRILGAGDDVTVIESHLSVPPVPKPSLPFPTNSYRSAAR